MLLYLCLAVDAQVLLHRHAGYDGACLGTDAGVLLGDGRRAHHGFTVPPLEVTGPLGGTVVLEGVRPPLAQRQRGVLDCAIYVVSVLEGWQTVLKHAAVG